MTKQIILVAGAIISLAASAHADTPAWCGGATFDVGSYDVATLGQADKPRDTLIALAKATCSNSDAAQAHRAEIDTARAAWGKRYGMAEDDWAEPLAWDKAGGETDADFSGNTLATLTPVDQYYAIARGFGDIAKDPLYVSDALDAQLSETGRLAFVAYCLTRGSVAGGADSDVVKWAVCQDDLDKLDLAKVYSELHADPHPGNVKFAIRVQAAELQAALAQLRDAKAKLIAKDGEYGRVFDVAAKARGEWAKTIGTKTALLDLVQAMDSAVVFHSRKQLDGCEAKTAAALATAVSAIPAKAFTGMHDNRDDPTESFAKQARNVLATSPDVTLAAIAYSECQPKTGTGNYAANLLDGVPTARGPRDYALAALLATDFKFDDTNQKGLAAPKLGQRPYPYGQAPMSVGGTVKSVKLEGDTLVVAPEKTSERVEDCVKEHQGQVVRIRPDGSLEREIICDRTAMVTRDTSYVADFKINPTGQKWLKPGVRFSATYANTTMDVIAVWPSKTASLPSMVLGGLVK
jgi:hypothetical protein